MNLFADEIFIRVTSFGTLLYQEILNVKVDSEAKNLIFKTWKYVHLVPKQIFNLIHTMKKHYGERIPLRFSKILKRNRIFSWKWQKF